MQVKITREQTSKYLDYFRQAHFAHLVPIRSKNTAVVERNGKKLYLADHSFASALTAPKAPGALLFENIVALHLMRKHGEKEVFYWRTGKGREVDFAVGPDDDVELTQVALELGNEETLEREVAALEEAMGNSRPRSPSSTPSRTRRPYGPRPAWSKSSPSGRLSWTTPDPASPPPTGRRKGVERGRNSPRMGMRAEPREKATRHSPPEHVLS